MVDVRTGKPDHRPPQIPLDESATGLCVTQHVEEGVAGYELDDVTAGAEEGDDDEVGQQLKLKQQLHTLRDSTEVPHDL